MSWEREVVDNFYVRAILDDGDDCNRLREREREREREKCV